MQQRRGGMMIPIRKYALGVLDYWYGTSFLRPLQEWRDEYAKIQADLEQVNEKITSSKKFLRDFSSNNTETVINSVYADYSTNLSKRSELWDKIAFLEEEENTRAWYHATRRRLIS